MCVFCKLLSSQLISESTAMQTNDESRGGPANEQNQANRVVAPWGFLSRFKKENRPAYDALITGMAVFAAVSIVAKWQKEFDFQLIVLTALCLMGFAFLLSAIVWVIRNRQIRLVISWFLTIVFLLWGTSLTCSVLIPGLVPLIPAPACHIYILWDDCSNVRDRLAKERQLSEGPVATVTPVAAPTIGFNPHDYQVSVYFDGAIARDAVLKMTAKLQGDGWSLQGLPQRGGVMRTRAALGYNEVRYHPGSPNNEAAAAAVARRLQGENLTPVQVKPAPAPTIAANSLEIWFSRP
jgi:hypothetical protein